MDLQPLFKMQNKLDSHIQLNHQLGERNLFQDKILALLVELGELANETRCFKFWSLKPASDRDTILEEFVDGFHFILSLGLECNYEDQVKRIEYDAFESSSLTEQFLNVYSAIDDFKSNNTVENYKVMFIQFLALGAIMKFDSQDIYDAYVKKNEVNFSRQDEGY